MLSVSLLAALLAVLPCPTRTQPVPQLDDESWLVAPAGCWTTRGGSSGRTRATDTEPVRGGDLEFAFAIDLDAALVGEPLFDPSFVVVEVAVEREKRELRVFDAETGRLCSSRTFDTKLELAPSFVDGVVYLRAESDQLVALRPSRKASVRVASASLPESTFGAYGAPLVFGDEVFVAKGPGLVRMSRDLRTIDEREAPFGGALGWLSPPTITRSPRGTTLVCGVIGNVSRGDARFAAFETDDLEYRGDPEFGFTVDHNVATDLFCLAMAGDFGTVVWRDDSGFDVGSETRRSLIFDERGEPTPAQLDFVSKPASRGRSLFGRIHASDGTQALCLHGPDPSDENEEPQFLLVATPEIHSEVVDVATNGSWAKDVLLFAGRAWHPETGRVLWHEPELEGLDLYPLERGVLAVRSPTRIEVWRAANNAVDVRHESAAAPEDASAGLALLRDGTTARGTFAIDGTDLVDSAGKKPLRRPLADVWFACREDGRVVVVSGARSLESGLAALTEELARDEFKQYADAAQRSNDPQVVRVALEHGGALGEDTAELEETLAALLAKSKSISSKQKERALAFSAARETRVAALREAAARSLTPEAGTNTLHVAALHELLEHAPTNAFARESIVALLPAGLTLAAEADLADWLDFAVAVAAHPVSIVPLRPESAPDLTPTEKRIGYLARGRSGVVGFESEHLLVVSSVDRPGAVARCVALGEHVCELLESWFAVEGETRTAPRKLEIVLHATRDEYLKESGAWSAGAEHTLAWTAGHYDLSNGVSRLYLPDGEEGWHEAARTLLHELTHHWLHRSCPRIEPGVMIPAGARGFWIVEGFAMLVEDHVVDVARGVVAPIDASSPRLDVVANSAGAAVIPWDQLVALPQAALVGLGAIPPQPIPLTWHLGVVAPTNGIGLFYAQSAALASYLFHGDGGRQRTKLLDYLVAYYSGTRMDLDFAEHFGTTAAELASHVVAHAQSAVRAR
jgi:hypothetical protein